MFKVVILGHGDMLANLIAGTLDAKCKIVGVFRYETLNKNPLLQFLKDFIIPSKECSYIKSYNLHEIKAKSANSKKFKQELLKLNPDIVFVGTWSEKLKKDIINLPKIAMINVHPSLLPKYRGPNPYLQTIKNMEEKTGLTFHLMGEDFDNGAILMQKTIDILPNDTGKELKQRTVLCARGEVFDLLQNLSEDLVIPLLQSEERATYYPQINDDEIMLDFEQSANQISAHIRAFYPWGKTYFSYNNKFFIPNPYHLKILENNTGITKARTIVKKSSSKHSITVVCGDGKLLEMNKLKLYGWWNKPLTTLYIKFFVKPMNLIY